MSVKFAKTVVPAYATPSNVIKPGPKPARTKKSESKRSPQSEKSDEQLTGGVFSPDDKPEGRKKHEKSPQERLLEEAIDASACFLVTHNGRLLASFVSEDDALLFEGELADIDLAHGVKSAICEVRDRRGRRMGGYVITAGSICSFVRDQHFRERFGGSTRKSA